MRRLFVLSLVIASACQRKAPVPTCDEMAAHVRQMMTPADDFARDVQRVFAARCTEDAWPDEVRSCIGETQSLLEPKNCKQKLVPELARKLDAELAAANARQARKQVPVVCAQYEQVLAKFVACEKVAPELRADVAAKFATAKAGWSSPGDKGDLAGVCGSAILLLKQAGADCPGVETW